jgi:molecular chaperone GrpE (heat shock protein)
MIGQKRLREEVNLCRTKFKKRKLEFDTCPNQTRINFRLKKEQKKRDRDGNTLEKAQRKKELLEEREKLQKQLTKLQNEMKEEQKTFQKKLEEIKEKTIKKFADFGTAKTLEEEYSKLKNNPPNERD